MKYKIMILIGTLPFIGVLLIGIINIFYGFHFLYTVEYGLKAFRDTLFIYSIIFWPLYLIGLGLIIYAIIKLRKLKK